MAIKNAETTALSRFYQIIYIIMVFLALGIGVLGIIDFISSEVVIPLIIFAVTEFGLTLGVYLYQADKKKNISDKLKIFYQWIGVTIFLIIILALFLIF